MQSSCQAILMLSLLALLALLALPDAAQAHGGGLDSHGCHTDRRTGSYHCHRATTSADSVSQRRAPASSEPAPARAVPAVRAYANCTEARAAGAAPLRRGDPGYGPHLDRDNDGIGCEPYAGKR